MLCREGSGERWVWRGGSQRDKERELKYKANHMMVICSNAFPKINIYV
jgi:hypothetical protein